MLCIHYDPGVTPKIRRKGTDMKLKTNKRYSLSPGIVVRFVSVLFIPAPSSYRHRAFIAAKIINSTMITEKGIAPGCPESSSTSFKTTKAILQGNVRGIKMTATFSNEFTSL